MTLTCPSCSEPSADGLLCQKETGRLRKDLEQLPLLMRDLQITYTRQSQAGTGGRGQGGHPPLFDARASRVADEVVNVIGGWIRDIEVGDLGPLAPSMSAWCTWLLARAQRIRGHRAVVEIVRDIAGCVRKINRAIDSHESLQFCGFCVNEPSVTTQEGTSTERCQGQLWAEPDTAFVKCPICDLSYDVARSRTKLLKEAEDQLVSAATILVAMPDTYGVSVNMNTFYSWTVRGRLVSKGHRDGVAVYRLGDALALARTAATRGRRTQ